MRFSPPIDRFVFEELEQRLLFSADVGALASAVLAAQPPNPAQPQYQSNSVALQSTAGSIEEQTRHEAVFIDGAVDGAQALADQLAAQQDPGRILEIHVLDAGKDGVAQISALLATQNNLDAIHIISHGNDGELQLGSTMLNSSTLLGNALAVSGWGTALASGADILLYGCDVAQSASGQQFVDSIGKLTGADMEASTNLTGNAARQGDWNLEFATGKIETRVAADAGTELNYSGILATFTVTNTNDSGAGSLREAITGANTAAGTDTISFDIGSGAVTITPLSALPSLTDTTILDGASQGGYVNAPLVELSGASAGNGAGITVGSGASGSTLKGFVINGFSDGILLQNVNSVTITGNYIGTDGAGTAAIANAANGIELDNASSNVIGGTTADTRNVISGNSHNGIAIGSTSTNNVMVGNYIGTSADGASALGNGWSGIDVRSGTNSIGGMNAGDGNLVSANLQSGIYIYSANGIVI
ncbi:MAG: DUF4347 domain-containing protein [Janthinobacterium lividum]